MAFASRPRSMNNSKVSQSADEEKALEIGKNEQQQMWAGEGETVMSYIFITSSFAHRNSYSPVYEGVSSYKPILR